MSATNYSDAAASMYAQIKSAWDAGTTAIVGYVPEIRWQGVEKAALPDGSKYWIRVSVQVVDEYQCALGNTVQGASQRLFESAGLIFVQLFCPRSKADAMDKGRLLAQLARNVFRGQNPDVRYKHARINDGIEPEQDWLRFNVVAEFEFDEIT